MPFRTRTIAWLVFCMFWLGFVYPRSHSGWIGPIREFEGAAFKRKPAYRYSILLCPDLPIISRHRLAFPVKSYQYDSVTCFLYDLTGFCIPRSHSGRIGPIGEFAWAGFIRKPAYRYSILISFSLLLFVEEIFALFVGFFVCCRWKLVSLS
jgi:hypothetical protein